MTDDTDYAERARAIKKRIGVDREAVHVELDELLCEALRDYGEDELVEEFEEQRKWYA